MSSKNVEPQDNAEKIEEGAIEALSKSEKYIQDNKKTILIVTIAVIVLIAGFFAYKNLYRKPHIAKAEEAIYKAEAYFGVDSFAIALNGNGADVQGFLSIINDYKNTPSANVAHAYAGICYYNLGEYENAIKHLEKFKSKDTMASPSIYGLIGDCYVNLGKTSEGIKYFEQAAKRADNDLLSPLYLLKAGVAYEALGDTEKARSSYQTIIDKYYASNFLGEAQKHLQALELSK